MRAHGRDLRKGRVSNPGYIYAVTTVTRNRYPYFREFHHARRLVWVLKQAQMRGQAETLCYVVMPDHLHWLFRLGETHSLQWVVWAVKAQSSRQIGLPVWQKGFYDHAVRDDRELLPLARYIVANPLRAGLVDHIGQYPHWDAIWL